MSDPLLPYYQTLPDTLRFVVDTGVEVRPFAEALFLAITGIRPEDGASARYDRKSGTFREAAPREFAELFPEVTHLHWGGYVFDLLTPPPRGGPERALGIPATREPTRAEFEKIRAAVEAFRTPDGRSLGRVSYWTARTMRAYRPYEPGAE